MFLCLVHWRIPIDIDSQLETFEDPIEAWVSDSITRLKVVFATSAVDRYRRETRKRLTQHSLGGLIQIKDFEILAIHVGPRPLRVTFLIQDFQSIGSDGSGGFGVPRPLDNLPEVTKLLDRLQELRSKAPSKGSRDFSTGKGADDHDSPPGTQSEKKYSSRGDRSRSASQEFFATQLPSSRLVNSSSLPARNLNGTTHNAKSNDSPTRPVRPLSAEYIMKNSLDPPAKTLETISNTTNAKAFASANVVRLASHLQPSGFPTSKVPGMVNKHPKQTINPSELLELLSNNIPVHKLNKRFKVDARTVEPGGNNRDSAVEALCPKLDDQGGKAPTVLTRNVTVSEQQTPSIKSTTRVIPCIGELNGEVEMLDPAKLVLEVKPVSLPVISPVKNR